jgi:hypothetical protein
MLIATPPVATGAEPPLEVAEAAAEEAEAAAEEAEGTALLTAALAEEAAPLAAASVAEAWASKKALVAQALTLLGRLLYQAGRVPASICAIREERELGSMMSFKKLTGTAVSMTVRMELGTEARRAAASIESDEVPVAWGAARAVAEKRRAARSLNCILDWMDGK